MGSGSSSQANNNSSSGVAGGTTSLETEQTDIMEIEIARCEADLAPGEGGKTIAQINAHENSLIQKIWKRVNGNLDEVAGSAFESFFGEYPELKDKFVPTQAGDADDSERDMILKAHCKHVLVTVGEAISVLGEQKKMADTLMKLGARHRERNADTHTFNIMCPHFISGIRACVGDEWSDAVNEAYQGLFNTIIYHITNGFENKSINA